MSSLGPDVRYSLRMLGRQPGFVVVASLSLAVGMGVNIAIFSALDALLLRPPPVREIDRTIFVSHADSGRSDRGTSFRAFEHYRDRRETFAAVMAYTGARPLVFTDGDRRVQVYAEPVAGDFQAIANIELSAGRWFGRETARTSEAPLEVVLSDAFRRRHLASTTAPVGATIVLNGRPFVVAGVARPEFTGFDREIAVDLWIPLTTWAHIAGEPSRLTGEEHWLTTVAELQDGVTLAQAQAAMAAAGRSLGLPPGTETRVRSVRGQSSEALLDILAIGGGAFAVGLLVLGVACVNVTGLLIARAAARQREMSVRLALGAGRARLMRLWLIESGMVVGLGAVLGLFVAAWILDFAVAFRPPVEIGQADSPTLPITFSLDYRVVVFVMGLSLLVAAVFGLIAGLHSSRPGPRLDLGTDRMSDRRFAPGFNLRSIVIATQMALCLLLLIPCGLLIRSWQASAAISPGFAAENVMLLPIARDQAGIRVQKPPGFEGDLVERLRRAAGVDSVTAMDPVPLWFGGNATFVTPEGAGVQAARTQFARIAPGYFATLRLPLVRGRDFATGDDASAPRVVIVNETMARRLWPDGDAIGRRLREPDGVMEVVGIARDAKYGSLADRAQPFMYIPLAQDPTNNLTLSLAVRGSGDSRQLAGTIEREVRSLVPNWPAFQFRMLDEGLELQRQLPRFAATLLGVLGVFALLLAAIGIYGVVAYVARQRTREIGIRLALGAPQANVLALLIRQGMTVCLAGAVIGIVIALIATNVLSSLLVGIGGADPLTYTVVPALLLGVAVLACYLPARQAARVNPLGVLRRE